ncbi:class I SAM-dependent methyltransferase [soil metagenome]
MPRQLKDRWSDGDAYQQYVGRWSRLVAQDFIDWLDIPDGGHWLDVGCGAGDMTAVILEHVAPAAVQGVDLSPDYIAFAQARFSDARARFRMADARRLVEPDGAFDCVVSGLVLNFVPHPAKAVREMARVAKPGGTVAAYVWDYADKIELMRYFWDAVVELFPEAADLDEGLRFPICNPQGLTDLWESVGMRDIETRAIDVPSVFRDFDDYWSPFLGGQGPAPGFAASLSESDRSALRETIRSRLPIRADGSIHLIARAWAVRGTITP